MSKEEASSSSAPGSKASANPAPAANVPAVAEIDTAGLYLEPSGNDLPGYINDEIDAIVQDYPDNTGADPTTAPTEGKPFLLAGRKIVVTKENIMRVQQCILDAYFLKIDNLERALLMVAYQSFDAVAFFPWFAAFCNRLGTNPAKVALMILCAFVMRGTNLEKMKGKSTAEFKALLTSWITAGLVQSSTDAKAVTVGRIAALYPHYACWVNCAALQTGIKSEIVTGATAPVFMRFTGAPSIVPDTIWAMYSEGYFSYMREFTKIITRDTKTGKMLEDAEIDRRMNTVKAIAAAQRKIGSYHQVMQKKYEIFLMNKMVINKEWGFILQGKDGVNVLPTVNPSPNQGPGQVVPEKGLYGVKKAASAESSSSGPSSSKKS